jgi:hypothetical protein
MSNVKRNQLEAITGAVKTIADSLTMVLGRYRSGVDTADETDAIFSEGVASLREVQSALKQYIAETEPEQNEPVDITDEDAPCPDEEDLAREIVISEDRDGGYVAVHEYKRIDRDIDFEVLFQKIRAWCDKNEYWPNIFSVNDHGNLALHDYDGKVLKGWV